MIETTKLCRSFSAGKKRRRAEHHKVTALDEVSFFVPAGETHGILGPNGAGKTTLIKILSTMLAPTSGEAVVAGHDVVSQTDAVRRCIGMVFGGDRGLYDRISARQNLVFWATLYRVDARRVDARAAELLERVGLADRADEPVERFSRGMRQRLHLARGLVGDPSVLFLDEPTVGMDPVAAKEFRSLIGELRAEGRTILLTTHDMREAEALCDRVTLVDRGRVLATEKTAYVGRLIKGSLGIDIILAPGQSDTLKSLAELSEVRSVERLPGEHTFRVHTESPASMETVMRWLVDRGVLSLQVRSPSLEEVYMRLVGERGLTV
ncbi:ABC-2 type transport system ATP-binding protein [Streptomyces sp. B3I7]|jgi:ABC-2 type transport system ATP-binding protein|uniref:ABC transporter ATP-binding protein n=1 Tax=unclassified Streptomyces TaxID=2593676 RepID=UPI0027885A1A|nr:MULTISPECIES: ABC transporter ATP-binding protein [unclassified Streptomyces]MDQ0790771.1 ABC-2 type transport system ATP-binding protein [Streptomyces sp. B3I8]MDQ0809491.1 ABC-2 type transport system ATP-binding protein [Streptomyces sp. B3I7]